MTYEIKITGSGTPNQLAAALRQIARQVQEAADSDHAEALLDGAEWEDPTLMTVITAE